MGLAIFFAVWCMLWVIVILTEIVMCVLEKLWLKRPLTPEENLRALRIFREYKNQGRDVVRK